MVSDVTSLQTDLTQPITFKSSILLKWYQMLVYYYPLSKLRTWWAILQYFNLKALIIPASKGCNLGAVFLGRNTNFMFGKFFLIRQVFLGG